VTTATASDERVLAGTRAHLDHWRGLLAGGAERVGWKIGLNVPAVQERLRIDGAVVGHLTSATMAESASAHAIGDASQAVVEPEIAVEVGRDGAVAALGAAIEVVDISLPFEDVEAILARNVFHRAFLLGPREGLGAPAKVEAVVSVNGEERARASASTEMTATVALVAESLAAAGERLEPGDVIIAGSVTVPVPVQPGDAVTVDLEPLGRLTADFTD
jgi:2-keto-4-pentenoate hydratase